MKITDKLSGKIPNRRFFSQAWIVAAVLLAFNFAGLLWLRRGMIPDPSKRPVIKVLAALPKQDVDDADRFSLLFEQPVADASLVGKTLDRSPFLLDPQPSGRWVWADPKRLDFILDRPLPPGRTWQIRPAVNIELMTGRALQGDSVFKFETSRLKVDDCRVVSVDQDQVLFELAFNQAVDPTELLKRIEVKDPGLGSGRSTPTLVTHEPSEKVVLRVSRSHSEMIEVAVDSEMKGLGADRGLGWKFSKRLPVPRRFALIGADIGGQGLQAESTVTLHFSHQLDRKQPLPAVQLDPPVPGVKVDRGYSDLILIGPFEGDTRYTASVGPEALSADGSSLGKSQSVTFTFPQPPPRLSFPHKKGILSTRGNQLLDLEAVNVKSLEMSATRVYPNNLVAALRGLDSTFTSKNVLAKTVELKMPPNTIKRAALDLNGLFESPRGIYSIYVASSDSRWTGDRATISLTDLGLTAKRFPGGTIAWVTELSTGKPAEGVRVTALSRTNQVVATCLSDEKGIAYLAIAEGAEPPDAATVTHFSNQYQGDEGYDGYEDGENGDGVYRYNRAFAPENEPWIIVAERGDDQAYLQPGERRWNIDDVDQSGRAYPKTYDLYLYTERGVYRPGDPIHLTGIIRDPWGHIPDSFPIQVTVTRPDGRDVAEIATKPDAQGIFNAEYATAIDGQTGVWRLRAGLPGARESLGEAMVNVEAFLPVRIDLKAKPARRLYADGEAPAVTIDARYLFGQAASELPLTVAGEYQRAAFSSQKFKEYSFGSRVESGAAPMAKIDAKLDAAGHADIAIPAPPEGQRGYWLGKFSATVTEVGGRSVSSNFSYFIDTAGRHIGLRLAAARIIEPQKPVRVDWVQRTGRDEAAPAGPMEMELFRIVHDSRVEYVNGQRTWKSTTSEVSTIKSEIKPAEGAPPEGTEEFACPESGQYKLRFTDLLSKNVAEIVFNAAYAREYGDEESTSTRQSVSMEKPERIEIVLDKADYEPGQTAKVLLRSPIAGTLMMSVETDRVVDQRVFEMKENTLTVEVPIHQNLVYGAFIAATVVRGIDKDATDWLPHRAIGLARINVDPKSYNLPIEITAPEKVFPEGKLAVTVRTSPPKDPERPGMVQLWAVDEGILMMTAYQRPDPFSQFYAPRGAVVASSDIFSDLIPDTKRAADFTLIGGDGSEEGLYRNPVAGKRRPPAVIWRAAAPVGPDGSLTVEMDIPAFTGELRIMAVAVDHDKYGSAQKKVAVAAPLMIETTWPRFVAPGDLFGAPVKLFNTTDQPATVKLGMSFEGPIEIDTQLDPLGYVVQPGEPRIVWLSVRAANGIGLASVKLDARAESSEGAVAAREEANFPVRPAAPIFSQAKLVSFPAGQTFKFDPPADVFPESVRATLAVSGRPAVELLPAVEALIDYPYGCVEQTTSRLLGMLYAPDLLAIEKPEDARREAAVEFINVGIGRLWSMQTPSGGIGYWPGAAEPSVWGTGYAAGFLLQAKRAGHAIPPRFAKELLDWMESQLRMHGGDQGADDDTRALFVRVLAGFERPNAGWMATLTERADKLDMAARAHLAAAWLDSGRKDQALAVLKDDTIALSIATTCGGRLVSQVSEEAALLDVLLDLDKEHPWIPKLVDRLMKSRQRRGYWGNTHENAAALAALARYQSLATEPSDFQGDLMIGDAAGGTFASAKPFGIKLTRLGDPMEIATRGAGTVYASLTYKGLMRSAAPESYDRQIEVRRIWKDALGNPADPMSLKVGDLINVEVSIQLAGGPTNSGRRAENIAIVDLLPAGMEVENPRLATSATNAAEQPSARPDRVEFLDDRVLLFTSVSSDKRAFRYPLRVVTAGTFAAPPIQADSMYDADCSSLNGGGMVKVASME